jgi:hypothetical protein
MLSCQHCDVKNESVDPLLLCEKCVKRLDLLDEAVGLLRDIDRDMSEPSRELITISRGGKRHERLSTILRKHEELP